MDCTAISSEVATLSGHDAEVFRGALPSAQDAYAFVGSRYATIDELSVWAIVTIEKYEWTTECE